jgi:hypothetical protein
VSFLPEISDSVVAFIRIGYGVLFLAMLVGMLPQNRRFFLSERWGGYAKSSPAVDAIQNPVVMPFVLAVWLLSAVLLVVGVWTVAAAFVSLLLARYFCIWMRWRGVLRGMGAPGFMTYWLAVAVCLLELTTHHAPALRPLVLFALQLDLAFIFLAAALYKLRSGYPRNQGMEFGLTNPQWGYWWRQYRSVPPTHALFKTLNHLAWMTELAAALAMLFPPTRFVGGLILIGTFAFIATQIRLALLCEMVMLAGVLFFAPDTVGGRLIDALVPTAPTTASAVLPPLALQIAVALIVAYIALLPLAYGGLVYNFYLRRRLPEPLQRILETYTNIFGIILWRVFSADLVNFLIEIRILSKTGDARSLVSDYRNALFNRFAHVCEMIAITSVFTTLKYYPSNPSLFTERLLRYARTLPCPADGDLVFEYKRIRKDESGFALVSIAEFIVDPRSSEVREKVIDASMSVRAVSEHSPVHEGVRPGSYAPPA